MTDTELAVKILALQVRAMFDGSVSSAEREVLKEAAIRLEQPPQECLIDLSRAPILQRLLSERKTEDAASA